MTTDKHERVPSPCIRQCKLDEEEVCRGCYRSITEIIGWGDKSDEQKRNILANCARRIQELAVS
ncbi:DUF1289 domain-containing protein [Oceanisphaera arctica]|uniref:DUF1289 domain-containing protein n=1 Tax=Oceanisphaera arctica TaxID=641510 RepID=A0A2P5TQM2_9GAMM|nr:DUF1289 domain-containing protein [Oceanisphaera arctica]PPL18080.1 hypothetical protein UN63_02670 [Oceanisphaera arctica]GHA09679.1 hypothetical protein GCM10007082_08330 [Oceanisphaera arctica]